MTDGLIAVDMHADRRVIDATLAHLDDTLFGDIPPTVADAIRYSVRGPGKRLRGILVTYAYRATGGTKNPALLAAAIEIIHAYSLVHDDLPCMDDDDVRRGRPTTHKAYDTRTAMVSGVTMIPLAVRCIARSAMDLDLSRETVSAIVEALMQAAGASGMIGGQWLDLEAEGSAATLNALEQIHSAKTGALIAASAKIGGLAAGASPTALRALGRFGADLGLAFQIVDDVLDVTSTTDQLGKTVGRDAALRKSTYPALLGVPGAIERARMLVQNGCAALHDAGLLTPELRHVADLIITRTN